MSVVIPAPPLVTIAQSIQLSLSPAFMLTGIGALLGVLAGRLARVIDRARLLEDLHEVHVGEQHERHVAELRMLSHRMSVINFALFTAVSSAVMNCLVVVLLFVAKLARFELGRSVAMAFILAMLFLIAALVSFLVEVRASVRTIRIRPELLQ